ncbi:MAG: hypothetical protein M3322_09360 [Actinomycetota bacterium]|nr:hypothetical protein [Actinomycetota bacterium]
MAVTVAATVAVAVGVRVGVGMEVGVRVGVALGVRVGVGGVGVEQAAARFSLVSVARWRLTNTRRAFALW